MAEIIDHQDKPRRCCDQPWCTWGVLVVLSLAMAATGLLQLPRWISVPFILGVMGTMAWLIASRFMHLREERRILIVTVVGSTIFTIVFLFVLTAWDAIHVLRQSGP